LKDGGLLAGRILQRHPGGDAARTQRNLQARSLGGVVVKLQLEL